MKRIAVLLTGFACLIAVLASPMFIQESSFAQSSLMAASDDSANEAPHYLTTNDMQTLDIDLAYACSNSLPMWFYCDAFETETEYDEAIRAAVYLKKPGGKFKKVKTITIDHDSYLDNYDEDEEYACDFKLKNLKPHTKYVVRVDCSSTKSGLTRSFKHTFWTAHKIISPKKAKKNGNKYTWKKVKGASGYIARYRKPIYLGIDEDGDHMWKFKYAAKIVAKPNVRLSSKYQLTDIIPFDKRKGYYYIHMVKIMKSKSKVLKRFKMTTDIIYN